MRAVLFLIIIFTLVACGNIRNNAKASSVPYGTENKDSALGHETKPLKPDTAVKVEIRSTNYADTNGLRLPTRFTANVYKGDRHVQSFEYVFDFNDGEPNQSFDITTRITDADFDGHADFLVYLGSYGNQGVEYYDCYLWNSSKGLFVHFPEFTTIENPVISSADNLIYSSARVSAANYEYSKYKIQNRRLVKLSTLNQTISPDRTSRFTETTFNNKGRVLKHSVVSIEKVKAEGWHCVMQ